MIEARPDPRKRRSWKRLKRHLFPRGISFTRDGKVYVGVTLGVGFAAVNTGNNLLFLVLGLMLGLIIVSGILSEITLRRISIRRRVPKRVEAGSAFAVELSLKNDKRWSGSFGVELRDEIDGEPFRRRCFFLRVGSGEERTVAYRCELNRRGRSFFDGTIVSTRFPFGLFEKRRFVELKNDIIVLPARIDISLPPAFSKEGSGAGAAEIPGQGQEFRELKEMVPGDDPRRIHWRATARLGRPFVKETNTDARGYVEVVLDAAPNGSGHSAMEQVEQNIRAAGTIIRDLTGVGITVRLVTSPKVALEAADLRGAVSLLTHLALIDPHEAVNSAPPLGRNPAAVLIGGRARSVGKAFRLSVPNKEDAPKGEAA